MSMQIVLWYWLDFCWLQKTLGNNQFHMYQHDRFLLLHECHSHLMMYSMLHLRILIELNVVNIIEKWSQNCSHNQDVLRQIAAVSAQAESQATSSQNKTNSKLSRTAQMRTQQLRYRPSPEQSLLTDAKATACHSVASCIGHKCCHRPVHQCYLGIPVWYLASH